jgi:hypothetical protein
MTRDELKIRLDDLKVNKVEYSLFSELFLDRIILFHNYTKWEVFYLDEKGGRNDERIFENESAACLYILQLLIESQKIKKDYKLNSFE